MKHTSLIAVFCCILALAACSKQQLPYDLEGVERGVAIAIYKVPGTSQVLNENLDEGDYQIELVVPEYFQGDMSMLKEAQLMAVHTDINGSKNSAYVVDGIKEFPVTLKLDIKDVCYKLGMTKIVVGDRIEFVPSYTLKSGTQVDGWSPVIGFNNTRFTWTLDDGKSFQYRVSYTAFAPFYKEHYKGKGQYELLDSGDEYGDGFGDAIVTQIDETPDAELLPEGVTVDKLVGLKIDCDIPNTWFGEMTFKMWINTLDFTIIMPDQVTCFFEMPPYGAYDVELISCRGEVDTLNETIDFYWDTSWGPYGFGSETMRISFPKE